MRRRKTIITYALLSAVSFNAFAVSIGDISGSGEIMITSRVSESILKSDNAKTENKKLISGVVKSDKGELLVGVSIKELGGGNNTAITGRNGEFSLKVGSDATVIVQHLYFLPQQIKVEGKTTFDIVMCNEAIVISDVKALEGSDIITKLVRGVVMDNKGKPLKGVVVSAKGTDIKVLTDAKGEFSLAVNSDARLKVEFIGLESREIYVANKTNLAIVLEKEAVYSNDVVRADDSKSSSKGSEYDDSSSFVEEDLDIVEVIDESDSYESYSADSYTDVLEEVVVVTYGSPKREPKRKSESSRHDRQVEGRSGVVTAGEHNDLKDWRYWSKLVDKDDTHSSKWKFYTNNRVAVTVLDSKNSAVNGALVDLLHNNVVVWQGVTDNSGKVDLWVGLNSENSQLESSNLSIVINDVVQQGTVKVTEFNDNKVDVNKFIIKSKGVDSVADIAFIVDATGSMADEIMFLKEDMTAILSDVSSQYTNIKLRTSALFYRDSGDDYLIKYSDFTENSKQTSNFISNQYAGGGGDYPEAVHDALSSAVQLSWNKKATARIAFLLLDAPAHDNDHVIESIHRSIKLYAAMGIKLIPIVASGTDKDTEFLCRFFSIATNGTYVFITDHSGVGEKHIKPSADQYKVELLSDLMVRLINKYIE